MSGTPETPPVQPPPNPPQYAPDQPISQPPPGYQAQPGQPNPQFPSPYPPGQPVSQYPPGFQPQPGYYYPPPPGGYALPPGGYAPPPGYGPGIYPQAYIISTQGPPIVDPDGFLRPYIYHKATFVISCILWQFLILATFVTAIWTLSRNLILGTPFASAQWIIVMWQATKFWCVCCTQDVRKTPCNGSTAHERFFLHSLAQLIVLTTIIVYHLSPVFDYEDDFLYGALVTAIFLTIVCWILWLVQVILAFVSRFCWFKRDFPTEVTPEQQYQPGCFARFTTYPHLHKIAIIAWSLIVFEAFLLAIAAGHAVYVEVGYLVGGSRNQYYRYVTANAVEVLVAQGLAIIVLFLVVLLAGEKQLLFRILGEKGPTIHCDTYEWFVFGPIEPLFLCALVSGMWGLVNSPNLNYMLKLSESSGRAAWLANAIYTAHTLRTTSIVFLVFAWVGVAVLSVFNFLPVLKPGFGGTEPGNTGRQGTLQAALEVDAQ